MSDEAPALVLGRWDDVIRHDLPAGTWAKLATPQMHCEGWGPGEAGRQAAEHCDGGTGPWVARRARWVRWGQVLQCVPTSASRPGRLLGLCMGPMGAYWTSIRAPEAPERAPKRVLGALIRAWSHLVCGLRTGLAGNRSHL